MAEVLAVALLFTILFVYSVNSDVLVPESHRSKSLIETCTSDCLKKVNVESNDVCAFFKVFSTDNSNNP